MKASKKLTPALILLALVAAFGLGLLSPMGKVMAESAARAVDAASFQADASAQAQQQCEDREVEADEGYGVSRKEIRRVCH